MTKILGLALATLLLSFSAFAETDQCPDIRGTFACPAGAAGAGMGKTTLFIQVAKTPRWFTYYYTWEEIGEKPVEDSFYANNEGRRQMNSWEMIGKCEKGYFYVAPYGDPQFGTRFVRINADGNYEATLFGDKSVHVCKRLR